MVKIKFNLKDIGFNKIKIKLNWNDLKILIGLNLRSIKKENNEL